MVITNEIDETPGQEMVFLKRIAYAFDDLIYYRHPLERDGDSRILEPMKIRGIPSTALG